ncbi:MAG: peptidoglycan editing factor PgeF [Candidatus Thioglobus sp.]|uniref:peptidoglycan editing factor PgeF n=1 Tax=Candidatus Thioglobus sp. TaxID=2026721 RepID=UPI00260F4248|nr:peptidoglycan editing factor PgeF [Candidatus Thioglobus sp.]MDC9727323.1 peptidoglycan editing factor PgeF [Candidatus Thioglobus sp.]
MSNFTDSVKLVTTTRFFDKNNRSCLIESGYDNFNLALHVGDNPIQVNNNRALLVDKYQLPAKPKFLEQTHSDICVDASSAQCLGDAVVTKEKGVVCAVMTADCLPIFASNQAGTQVGVAHAGWQGIVNGIIESFVAKFDGQELRVHFGPAISQANFEVGQEVYDQFIAKDKSLAQAFITVKDKYKLDIYQAARIILKGLGIESISGGNECTFAQKGEYFSYRRDGNRSGRMAHLIWLE